MHPPGWVTIRFPVTAHDNTPEVREYTSRPEKLALNNPATHQRPTHAAKHQFRRYGHILVQTFKRLPPKLDTRDGIADEHGKPEITEGAIIGVQVEHLPRVPAPKLLWLWA